MGIANIINTSSSSGGGGSFGSLDIGNGLGGDPDSTAVGQNALDSSLSTSISTLNQFKQSSRPMAFFLLKTWTADTHKGKFKQKEH